MRLIAIAYHWLAMNYYGWQKHRAIRHFRRFMTLHGYDVSVYSDSTMVDALQMYMVLGMEAYKEAYGARQRGDK